jgi:hypothetical protein
MFQLVFRQKSTKNCHEQHKKLPEIFFPAFGVVGVVVDFHKVAFSKNDCLFQSYALITSSDCKRN